MGLTLDMLGASSYLWRFKHNLSHHTYTNLAGADDDINFVPFARLSPAQPRYRLHHLQQFYLWALYWFLFPKWNFVDDFKTLSAGANLRAAGSRDRAARPPSSSSPARRCSSPGRSWSRCCSTRGGLVLLFYAATSLVLGTTLAVVFMLAHCVEEAEFPELPPETERLPRPWAVHQVETTVDFAGGNRLLTWYVGGLNFQIEHHLFPRICHVHYPRIAEIVRAACAEFGVRYAAHDTFHGALASHWRWLRRMGNTPALAARRAELPERTVSRCAAAGARDRGCFPRRGRPNRVWAPFATRCPRRRIAGRERAPAGLVYPLVIRERRIALRR